MLKALTLAALLLGVAVPAMAHPQYFYIEYSTGTKWKPGNLALDGETILVLANIKTHGKNKPWTSDTIATIPLSAVVKAESSTRREDGNRVMSQVFGFQVETDNREYVTLTTETATEAKAMIFRVPEHTSQDIVAKIDFAVKHARAAVAP